MVEGGGIDVRGEKHGDSSERSRDFFPKERWEGFGLKGFWDFMEFFHLNLFPKNLTKFLKLGFPKFSNDNSKLIFEMTNKGYSGKGICLVARFEQI